MTDAVDPFKTEGDKDFLTDLVGEGKKFKDVQALAKGKQEADTTIELMKAELATLREQANNGKSVAELLEAFRAQDPETNRGQPPITPPAPNSFKEEDVRKIALDALKQTEAERTTAQNRAIVLDKMQEVWGTDASKKLSEVASFVGMSLDQLNGIAIQSPNAFFQLTGLNANRTPSSGTTVPTSTVQFAGSSTNKRDAAYYRELRRTNPTLYKEQRTKVQMQRDAIAQGQSFFN